MIKQVAERGASNPLRTTDRSAAEGVQSVPEDNVKQEVQSRTLSSLHSTDMCIETTLDILTSKKWKVRPPEMKLPHQSQNTVCKKQRVGPYILRQRRIGAQQKRLKGGKKSGLNKQMVKSVMKWIVQPIILCQVLVETRNLNIPHQKVILLTTDKRRYIVERQSTVEVNLIFAHIAARCFTQQIDPTFT
eukprot:XP_011677890.1 PREDICTED: uncharacterized protein LOC105444835 [Strongylocentrotus purpuratus]